ncbi:MAG: hypothetical protein OEZ38_11305 [Gammaproteobacteria bacterium]|nr:hypothetical protein [Gammaproteobacteria bacterium]
MNRSITIQSGRPSSEIDISPEAQNDIRQAFIINMRQRFKTEINRLTRGDMQQMLVKIDCKPNEIEQLHFLLSYVYAWHWLQNTVYKDYQAEILSGFSQGPQGFLMGLLLNSQSNVDFIENYIHYWQNYQGEPQLQQQYLFSLLQHLDSADQLAQYILNTWNQLGLFTQDITIAYKDLAREEKQRYADMLGEEDKQRLALVDSLPDLEIPAMYNKAALIPAMGCPQTCRHCMFIFRPLMKNTDKPDELFKTVNQLTTSVLFTGGDLTQHLDHFYHAIASMPSISTFAILLNGDFANNRKATNDVLNSMARAIRRRPVNWSKAKIILQISFDEFHQEVIVDRKGQLKERIPVTKIANIVEAAPRYADEIQLCLLHKQGHLNFSMDLFKKGVFARLALELGRRGHQVEIISTAPSSRLKRNPLQPDQPAQLIKDASFVLDKYPDTPLLFTSSTIDAYGRANTMELHETVNERDLLLRLLNGEGSGGETFDKDMMFWFNGWATLFSAVHICLGNIFEEGIETIRQRQAKDPLTQALHRFDLKLLDYYRECHDDLDMIIEKSTSPHHLFHTITEDAATRLHMTKMLIKNKPA